MDMSGFAGLAAQDELDERQDKSETHTSNGIWGTAEGMVNVENTYSVGFNHACAIMDNNTIYCWGYNGEGQLGIGTKSNENAPTLVLFNAYTGHNTAGTDWSTSATPVEISLGDEFSCARMSDGGVVCWGTGSHNLNNGAGSNNDRENPIDAIPLPGVASAITAGKNHACAILQDDGQNIDNGSVYCWGSRQYGQMGDGGSNSGTSTVVAISLPTGAEAKQLVAGSYHTCAIMTNDSMYCWGSNYYGQLGDGTRCDTGIWTNNCNGVGGKNTPTQVNLPANEVPIQIAASEQLTCAVMKSYKLYCWGYGNHVIDGSGSYRTSPMELFDSAPTGWNNGPSGIVEQVALSNWNRGICVLTILDTVSCWGFNSNYILGVSSSGWIYSYYSALNQTQTTGKTISSINIGGNSGCRTMNDSTLECWGSNNNGEAGVGNNTAYITSITTISGNHHLKMSNFDDDGDTVQDMFDNCPNGLSGWTSTPSTDYDGDGCKDSVEDDDDDNDGYADSVDSAPLDAYVHNSITAINGFVAGVRYENVTIAPGPDSSTDPAGTFITEDGCIAKLSNTSTEVCFSQPVRSLSSLGKWLIMEDNTVLENDGGTIVSDYSANSLFSSFDPPTSIVDGSGYSCALLESGSMVCWGDNGHGNFGDGTTGGDTNSLREVNFPLNSGTPSSMALDDYDGGSFTCAVMDDGDVYCWGQVDDIGLGSQICNLYPNSCLGTWSLLEPVIPLQFPGTSSPADSVYASYGYTSRGCAVLEDGNAYCWGEQNYGELGNGFISATTRTPTQVLMPTASGNIISMVLGRMSTCALTDTGDVYCWGYNSDERLGDGTTCSGSNNFANNCNGNGVKPIAYDPVVLPSGTSVISLVPSGSDENYCALLDNGRVYCWGSYYSDGDGIGQYLSLSGLFVKSGNRDWDADGVYNTRDNCAASTTGWLSNLSNDLDSDGCDDATLDDDDDGDNYYDSTEISCGTDPLNSSDYPQDIDSDGLCAAFDDDDDGDGVLDVNDVFPNDPNGFIHLTLGDGFQSGQPLDNVSMGTTDYSNCVILTDETLRCWGSNSWGQIGDGTIGTNRYVPVNVTLPSGKQARSLSHSSSSQHICAVMDDGSLYCWGKNRYGQIGDGTACTTETYQYGCNGGYGRSTPVAVSLPPGRTATAVTTGERWTCAILDDGSVWCWGYNGGGRLGVGNATETGSWAYSPQQTLLPSGRTAIAISAGSEHTCAVLDNNSIVCWGGNGYSQLGYSTSSESHSTIPDYASNVYGLATGSIGFNSIASGNYHNCAISTDNIAYCWGMNQYKQLGNDSGPQYGNSWQMMRVSLPAAREAMGLSLGHMSSCAILDDESVYCWGYDENNRLNTAYHCDGGDYSNGCYEGQRRTPAESIPPTGRSFIAMARGENHGCALVDNGGVYCFGSNSYGVLGNGSNYGNGPNYLQMGSGGISLTTSDRDTDHDGVFNNGDRCMNGQTGWTSNSSTDYDHDGCRDSDEDLDDDADGWTDTDEAACGTQSLNASSIPLDTDGDMTCDVVDTDDDNDSVLDASDDCPTGDLGWNSNSSTDHDSDGCQDSNEDIDDDNDGVFDWLDLCSLGYLGWTSSSTTDYDSDGCRDADEDTDDDNDSVVDTSDACAKGVLGWTSDSSTDHDGDGCKDSTSEDLDDDNDGWTDTDESACGTNSLDSSSIPVDTDSDGQCDVVDTDDDNDGTIDDLDAFPLDPTEDTDTDSDGIGNNADTDDDNDAWSDTTEVSCGTDPLDSSSIPVDTDSDGTCDSVDTDDDNDGTLDENDAFPLDPSEDTDTDSDGIGNNNDTDDDNDGWFDTIEVSCGYDPLNSSSYPIDTDLDGICDALDLDDDNDGYNDTNDSFPEDPTEWNDTDSDGVGDNADTDDDNDNVTDSEDAFPLDPNESSDWDGDGIGDNADEDDDNDGLTDTEEAELGTNSTNPDTDGDNYTDDEDAFPLDANESSDWDGDGIGDNTDTDDDDDSWEDSLEVTCQSDPLDDSSVPLDTDSDGDCDILDTDDDNDGVLDENDAFPLDAGATNDTDGDGMPDFVFSNYTGNLTVDLDDDNDGWNDTTELDCGNDPLDVNDVPNDRDNDTYCDPVDLFPDDPNEWEDTDGDGVGDNGDVFPSDPSEWNDTDGDGIGDNADPDADNDGWFDYEETNCNSDWLNSSSVPNDYDSNGLCNEMDSDADNDGWINGLEDSCLTNWLDELDIPLDSDSDTTCDVLDPDDDNDFYPDDQDAFPLDPLEWADFDNDSVGDNADPDDDNDGCMDNVDDLPYDPTECTDTDQDGSGDNADTDDDNDGILDENDAFPLDPSASTDTDGDGMPDTITGNSTTGLIEDFDDDNDGYNDTADEFPLDSTEWIDSDGDGIGNNADPDDDGDGCVDTMDTFPLDPAECYDTDGDGIGNNADPDDDNDGWLDTTESICGTSDPLNASSIPDDNDGDGVCDLLDYDDDNDNYIDTSDAFPMDPCAAVDTDQDGDPDWIYLNCNTTLTEDLDDDNDGYLDANDTFPQDPNEWSDFDSDGIGDNYDSDDDGDQVPDQYDAFPMNATEWADNDGDGIGDNADLDDDNDGVLDDNDAFPNDPAASTDTDGDGMPDTLEGNFSTTLVEDQDDDNDGVLDIYDWAPLDATEWVDTDGDGIGDNADADDDGDGWSDSDEYICGSNHLDPTSVPPDGDGDGICDSEDGSDTSTLSGRIQYYMNSPVTVWMAVMGILCALVIGATGSSLRSAKERRMLVQQTVDYSDSLSGHENYGSISVGQVEMPIPKMTPSQIGRQELVQKYLNQGYSSEVANILADDELNN